MPPASCTKTKSGAPLQHGSARKCAADCWLAVDGLFQGLASAELRHARRRNLNLGARARIAAGRGLTLRDLEISETYDPDGVAALQSSLDILEGRVHGLLGHVFR